MATNNYGTSYGELWAIYNRQVKYLEENPNDSTAKRYQEQILHWMDLPRNLPILSHKTQLEVLDNAPMPIVKAHAHLLHEKARKALGLEQERPKVKPWSYGKLEL